MALTRESCVQLRQSAFHCCNELPETGRWITQFEEPKPEIRSRVCSASASVTWPRHPNGGGVHRKDSMWNWEPETQAPGLFPLHRLTLVGPQTLRGMTLIPVEESDLKDFPTFHRAHLLNVLPPLQSPWWGSSFQHTELQRTQPKPCPNQSQGMKLPSGTPGL